MPFLALLLAPARPALSSVHQPAPAVSAPSGAGGQSPLDLRLDRADFGRGQFRSEFKAEYRPDATPSYLLQRGEYGGKGFGVVAEMGDIRIKETLVTVHEAAGRGGRFGFLTENSGNKARFETFAAKGAHGKSQDDMLVGATGELSLLDSSARFKTILLSGRHSLDAEGRWPDSGEKKGDVLGFLAVVDPFEGKLAAEAELNYSTYDGNTADTAAAVRDSACRLKLGGGWGSNRYTALYERTGPQYRLMSGSGPARDSEGLSLGMGTAFQLHAFDVKLSRYNDNVEKRQLAPRLYRYEGLVDYRFKGFKTVPLSLQYKKTFIDSTNEPLGHLPKEVEEEAVSGRMNFLAGRWDLGVRGTLTQRMNKFSQKKEAETHTVGFLPKFAAGPLTVAPDFSLKRVNDLSAKLRTDHYIFDLGLNGRALKKRLDYEVKGGFKKEETAGAPGRGKQVIGAKLKAAYPLARFFNWTSVPSLRIKGEYKGIAGKSLERRENDFSLMISLDGVKFL